MGDVYMLGKVIQEEEDTIQHPLGLVSTFSANSLLREHKPPQCSVWHYEEIMGMCFLSLSVMEEMEIFPPHLAYCSLCTQHLPIKIIFKR